MLSHLKRKVRTLTQIPRTPCERHSPTSKKDAEGVHQKDEIKVESSREAVDKMPKEVGGPKGPEPTRYGDWERKARVSDF